MCVYYYRAYDEHGDEKKGVVNAPDERSADRRLRRTGLKPFFISDYVVAKHLAHQSKTARRRKNHSLRRILVSGAAIIMLAFAFGVFIEDWAGKVAPDVDRYAQAGVLAGATNVVYGATPEERALAQEFAQLWRTAVPDTLAGLEATGFLVAVHVNDNIAGVDRADTESVMAHFLRAMRRRFNTSAPTVLLVYAEATLAEATYDETKNEVVVTYY